MNSSFFFFSPRWLISLMLTCTGCVTAPLVHQIPGWQPVQVTVHAPLDNVIVAAKQVFQNESVEIIEEVQQSNPPVSILIAKDHARPKREAFSKMLIPLTGSWLEFVLECHFTPTPHGTEVSLAPAIGTRRIGLEGYSELMPTVPENWPYRHAQAMAQRIQQVAEHPE